LLSISTLPPRARRRPRKYATEFASESARQAAGAGDEATTDSFIAAATDPFADSGDD
jgi:hypothetical protein